eukprot:EG_transcript_12858
MPTSVIARTLTPQQLWGVCHFLSVAETLTLSLACRTFRSLVVGHAADAALWRVFADRALDALFPPPTPAPSRHLADWNVSSYLRLCQILCNWGCYLGRWIWDVPVRGGLLLVRLDMDEKPYTSIIADLIMPNRCSTLTIQNVTELHTANFFEVRFSDEECSLDLDSVLVCRPSADSLHVSGEAALRLAESCEDPCWPAHGVRQSPLQVLREYLHAMAAKPLRFRRLCDVKPGALPPPLFPGEFHPGPILGVYEGVFGPHGLELIHVSLAEGGQLQGLKVTGDPNVPAGELCFQSVGPFEEADATCSCQYGCGCWRPDHDPSRGWELKGMYRVETKTAMHGYQDPKWNAGRLLVCTRREAESGGGNGNGAAAQAPSMNQFLIVVWDGLFSTRLAPLQE